jgi:hypothetical protein
MRSLLSQAEVRTHHAVLVRVDGERLSLEAVEPDGTVFDRVDSLASGE